MLIDVNTLNVISLIPIFGGNLFIYVSDQVECLWLLNNQTHHGFMMKHQRHSSKLTLSMCSDTLWEDTLIHVYLTLWDQWWSLLTAAYIFIKHKVFTSVRCHQWVTSKTIWQTAHKLVIQWTTERIARGCWYATFAGDVIAFITYVVYSFLSIHLLILLASNGYNYIYKLYLQHVLTYVEYDEWMCCNQIRGIGGGWHVAGVA